MADSKAYDDLIMDHIKNARNYRALPDATHRASGANPLCGDDLAVFLRLDGDRIVDAAFQCTCCGISMASASLMTNACADAASPMSAHCSPGVVAATHRARRPCFGPAQIPRSTYCSRQCVSFPRACECAALPWVTLEAALDNRPEPVSVD